MKQNKNIVYLYSEVMPYSVAVMRALVSEFNAEVDCIYWDEKKKTPYLPENENGITFHKRSAFDKNSMQAFIDSRQPEIIYVSGRMDKLYLEMALHYRAKGVKLISACDNQWTGSAKQVIGSIFGNYFLRRYFEYIWIPGTRQYEYVRRMGYHNDKIMQGLYSADTSKFEKIFADNHAAKRTNYPHSIVFVGRFTEVKGIDILISAFNLAKKDTGNDWKLVLVGSGNLKFESTADIQIIDFLPNAELAQKSKDWGVFCLPSVKEAWGVVVHELAAAGLPLVCSEGVGAGSSFIINGYNGFTFKTGNVDDLKNMLLQFMAKTDGELWAMGERSRQLSEQISPVKSAYTLMSILQ